MSKYTNGINISYCMSEVRKMKSDGYSLDMLVCMIYEAYQKHAAQEKLTQRDRFLLGLRYSEFYAEDSSDNAYYVAEVERQEYLRALGIESKELNKKCKEIAGLA